MCDQEEKDEQVLDAEGAECIKDRSGWKAQSPDLPCQWLAVRRYPAGMLVVVAAVLMAFLEVWRDRGSYGLVEGVTLGELFFSEPCRA